MAYNHRIDTEELDTQLVVPVQGTSGLQVVFGTAPVNLAEEPEAVVNTPVIINNMPEAQRLLGYSDDFKAYTLCQSMDANFNIFNISPVVFINVLDPKRHKKTLTSGENVIKVTDKKATITETGILMDTLRVMDQAGAELTKGTDYLAEFNLSGGVDITLLTTEKTTAVTGLKAEADQLDPTMIDKECIIGGYDSATGRETGLEVIRQVYPKLGLVPGILLAPEWSKIPEVAAVMCAKAERINGTFSCEAAIDMDCGTTKLYTALKEAKEAMGMSSPHGILLWPKVKLEKKQYSYSAVWAAMTARTDAENGDIPCKSPSNELLRVSSTVLEDGTEIVIDTSMAELINSFGIVTAINDNGWKSWGNNTAAYPGTTDPRDRWINCRRMMNWYRNHFILTYKNKIDDNTNYRLIESVIDSENQYLNGLAPDKLAGGSISFNEDENPIQSILDGNIVFHTKIAFWTPAEFINNQIEFDPTIIQNALGGE